MRIAIVIGIMVFQSNAFSKELIQPFGGLNWGNTPAEAITVLTKKYKKVSLQAGQDSFKLKKNTSLKAADKAVKKAVYKLIDYKRAMQVNQALSFKFAPVVNAKGAEFFSPKLAIKLVVEGINVKGINYNMTVTFISSPGIVAHSPKSVSWYSGKHSLVLAPYLKEAMLEPTSGTAAMVEEVRKVLDGKYGLKDGHSTKYQATDNQGRLKFDDNGIIIYENVGSWIEKLPEMYLEYAGKILNKGNVDVATDL